MRTALIVTFLVACSPGLAAAAIVGFKFAGEVTSLSFDPFDGRVGPLTEVSGIAFYDDAAPPTDPFGDEHVGYGMGYRQHIVGGFSAMFGDIPVSADDYVVEIRNDYYSQGLTKFPSDSIAFYYSSKYSPALPTPLTIDGTPHPSASFIINLDANIDTFADATLPSSLALPKFGSSFNVLDREKTLPVNYTDVIFKLSTLSRLQYPGDYDQDEAVAQGDYNLWRRTFGESSILDADGNRNGTVDAADYVLWRQNYLTVEQPVPLPEPSAAVLITASLLFFASRQRPVFHGQV